MTVVWFVVAAWLSPAAALLARFGLRRERRLARLVREAGARALAEDIEVMSLEFTWALPSFEEGIHAS